jgi:hypothetical protein
VRARKGSLSHPLAIRRKEIARFPFHTLPLPSRASEPRPTCLLFACLGKIDLTDYLHSDRSSVIGCSDFLKSLDDTSTLKLSQRLDHSHVESVRILGRRTGLPEPSADLDF